MSELFHENPPSSTKPISLAGESIPPTRVSGAQGVLSPLTRRRFLAASSGLFGIGALGSLSGCADSSSATPAGTAKTPAALTPSSTAGAVAATDAPEVTDLKFGIIALTDCSPIVIAHEKGLFKKYGINSTVMKGASWAAIRDSLTNGDLHATHMLIGMPIASTMGLLGSPKKPMVVPWLLNRNAHASDLAGRNRTNLGA